MISETKSKLLRTSRIVVALTIVAGTLGLSATGANAEDDDRHFPETDKTVSGRFLDYWDTHGGLAQQGFPISAEMQDVSDIDGQTYTVQYFERAVFEMHPENAAPYDVLLSLLGTTLYNSKYKGNAPGQQANENNSRAFSETGKTIGGAFRAYWERNGGLAQQGYPISDEFEEESATDGKTFTVQYFERAVFELHPENAGKPSEVLLSLLGTFRLNGGNGNGGTTPGTPPNPPAGLNAPGWTHITVTANKIAIFYNANTGVAYTARLETDGSLTLLQKYLDASRDQGVFGKGWTSVEAGPNNQLVLYAAETGDFRHLKVGDDGQVSAPGNYTYPTGDKLTIDPISGMMFWQNKGEKTTRVDRLYAEGIFVTVRRAGPDTGGISDDLVVFGMANGLWYDYAPDTGLVNFLSMNDKGEFVEFAPPTFIGTGVTQIVSDYHKYAVFYSRSEAVFKTAKVTFNGEPIQITNGARAEKSWSIVAGTQSIFLICYDDKGNIQTNYVVPENGWIAPLKTYEAGK